MSRNVRAWEYGNQGCAMVYNFKMVHRISWGAPGGLT